MKQMNWYCIIGEISNLMGMLQSWFYLHRKKHGMLEPIMLEADERKKDRKSLKM